MSINTNPVVVLDNGSGYLKCGFSDKQFPDFSLPAIVGRPMLRYEENLEGINIKPIMIGDEVIPVRSQLELKHPISEGIIKDKEELEILWDYALTSKLNLNKNDLKEHYCMVTEAPLNPFSNKKLMCDILLDKFSFGGMNIEAQAKLTLIYKGLESGLVLDSGDGVTHIIPVVFCHLDHHNIQRLNIAGRHITQYLIRLLQTKGYAFNSSADFEVVREIKEKFCIVSSNIEQDRKLAKETTFYNSYYNLKTGLSSHYNIDSSNTNNRSVLVSNEKFEAPEILFDPMLIMNECPGVQKMIVNCVQSCPMDNRKLLYNNIILSGATTLFPGFSSRLDNEVKRCYQETVLKSTSKKINIDINIIDDPNRQYAVFGGAVYLGNFYRDNSPDYWISRNDWLECGDQIIYKRCSNIMV